MKLNEFKINDYLSFIKYLNSLKEDKYRLFQQKLIITKYEIIGIKLPVLRRIAHDLMDNYKSFLSVPNEYFEIVVIKGYIIGQLKNIDEVLNYFKEFVSLIDNWAICDTFCGSLKIVNKNKDKFINIISELINSNEEYLVRVGLVLLLDYYVEEDYLEYIFEIIDKTTSELYYINMARAWLLCECFIKYENETLKYLENNNLDKFTINKTISKIRDSFRVDKKTKDYILKFKR